MIPTAHLQHMYYCTTWSAFGKRVGADALFDFHMDKTMLILCGGSGGGCLQQPSHVCTISPSSKLPLQTHVPDPGNASD